MDGSKGAVSETPTTQRRMADGKANLADASQAIASWPTPAATDGKHPGTSEDWHKRRGEKGLRLNDHMAHRGPISAWTTPQAHDSSPRGKGQKAKHGTKHGCACLATDAGKTLSGFPAQTESKGQLNPAFSLWLMGYPPAWLNCAPQATRSRRNVRQPSSKQRCEAA